MEFFWIEIIDSDCKAGDDHHLVHDVLKTQIQVCLSQVPISSNQFFGNSFRL